MTILSECKILRSALPFQRAASRPRKQAVNCRDQLSDLLIGLRGTLTSLAVSLPRHLGPCEFDEFPWLFHEVIGVGDHRQEEATRPESRSSGIVRCDNALPLLAQENVTLTVPELPQWAGARHTGFGRFGRVHRVRSSPLTQKC